MWNKSRAGMGLCSSGVTGVIQTPSVITPANGVSGLLITVALLLTASAFVAFGVSYVSTDFEVRTATGGGGVLTYASIAVLGLTVLVPALTLALNTTYFIRVRHRGSSGYISAWSADSSFTTSLI